MDITPDVARGDAPPEPWKPENDPEFMADLRKLKEGAQPMWTGTFEHPIHGEVTFHAELPKTPALTKHAVLMDNMFRELDLDPRTMVRGHTALLVAARAGLATLMSELPILSKEVTTDDGNHAAVRIVRYDPDEEWAESWLVMVWLEFSAWRGKFGTPEAVEALKNCSGGTPGDGSSEPSTEPTGAPPAIPA